MAVSAASRLSSSSTASCSGRSAAGPVRAVRLVCPHSRAAASGRGRLQLCREAPAGATTATVTREKLSEAYNREMQQQMHWQNNPFEYHFERGLYYHEVHRNLICGTQPRNRDDVTTLRETERITHILNLQQDKDMQYWGVNIEDVRGRCHEMGIQHVRRPARDFDPHSLRKTIPSAVQALHEALSNGGRVYVHCTAGLGRAPAVCIAYLYWFAGGAMSLDQAYKHLTDIRPCGPKRDAIRGATFDLLDDRHFEAFEHLPKEAWATLSAEDCYALQYRVLKGGR